MREVPFTNLNSFLQDWSANDKYFEMLRLMAQLSRLFSDNEVPYLDYRLTENLFCRYFQAMNDARSCTAYDARFGSVGIGIKTFILNKHNQSVEKIAEFNKLKKELKDYEGLDLAIKIGQFRNDRMHFANNQYGVCETQYHIVGRKAGMLRIFNTPYEEVDLSHIHLDKDDDTSCSFHDEKNEFIFNKSKSVLMKRFILPNEYKDVPVEILDEPLELLESFFAGRKENIIQAKKRIKGVDYVVLPLFSTSKARGKYVPEKSGINQFNAGGRARHPYEVYIPVPKLIHKQCEGFFPDRDTTFELQLPDGKKLSAKICQDNGKALMSNPNRALGEWLLHKVLKKPDYEVVTIDDLNRLGFDSVCVENLHTINDNGESVYRISFSNTDEGYEDFIMIET